ncbi:barstar family protein [Streptomyces sp. NPDC005485]|uniref:barstar family protein n=1 Tax=Streptomyces sp. NPDC005485 TaxID=3155591 RepID=UPI0033A2E1C2
MTGTTAWISPLTQGWVGIPTRREVAASHCRTSRGLFAEWAEGLGFLAHFGRNWDAFRDSLGDAVANTDVDASDPHNPPRWGSSCGKPGTSSPTSHHKPSGSDHR